MKEKQDLSLKIYLNEQLRENITKRQKQNALFLITVIKPLN